MSLIGCFSTEAGPLLFEDWGEAVQFLRPGETDREVTAVVVRGPREQRDNNNGKHLVRTAQVQFYDDADTGVDDLQLGDGIETADGTVWDFQSIVDRNGGIIIGDFESAEIAEVGLPNIADS